MPAKILNMDGPEYSVSKPIVVVFLIICALYAVGCSRAYHDTMELYENTLPAEFIAAEDVQIRTVARQHASHWTAESLDDIDPWAEFPEAAAYVGSEPTSSTADVT